jgi:hypothetical protein
MNEKCKGSGYLKYSYRVYRVYLLVLLLFLIFQIYFFYLFLFFFFPVSTVSYGISIAQNYHLTPIVDTSEGRSSYMDTFYF